MASTVHVQCTEGTFYSSKEESQLIEKLRKECEDAGYTLGHFGSGSGQTDNSQDTSNQETVKQAKSCEHDYVESITKEATCAEDGEMISKCSKCGDSYKTVIPATGKHDYVSETTKEATCTEAGVLTYTCKVCGDSYTEEIPIIDHKYEESVTKDATCLESGEITYTCSMCGDSYTEEIAATGHEAGTPIVTKEAGWFTPGEKVTRCTRCEEVLSTEAMPSRFPVAYLYILISVIAIFVIVGISLTVMKKKNAKSKLAKSA